MLLTVSAGDGCRAAFFMRRGGSLARKLTSLLGRELPSDFAANFHWRSLFDERSPEHLRVVLFYSPNQS